MIFQHLPLALHKTAEAAKAFFKEERGAKGFKYEEKIDLALELRPTLVASMPDKSILCVEVSTRVYSPSMDTFVLEAFRGGWPIHLYVAVPDAKGDQDFPSNLRLAKDRGVGVLLCEDRKKPYVYSPAVSLSLYGLPPSDLKAFPAAKRHIVASAEETFLGGNPVKGCQAIYEEIENVTRLAAAATKALGLWKPEATGPGYVKNLDRDPWALVLENAHTYMDFKNKAFKSKCPKLTGALVATTMALPEPRNQVSHKPSPKTVQQRDRLLRQWFEGSRELLRHWYEATKPLKV